MLEIFSKVKYMKCISCSHPIPMEFSFAIDTNRCPKCGSKLIDSKVKSLFKKMDAFVKEGNDLVDLAKWFIDTQLQNENTKDDDPIDEDVEYTSAPRKDKKAIKKASDKEEVAEKGNQSKEGPLMDPDRLKLFQSKIKRNIKKPDVESIYNEISLNEYDVDSQEDLDLPEISKKELSPQEVLALSNNISSMGILVDESEMIRPLVRRK